MNVFKKLVELVFEKARNESHSKVLTQQAKYIVDEIENRFNFNITDKTLRNYFNDLIQGKNPNVTIRPEIADHLSRFLEYQSFADFKSQNIIVTPKGKTKKNISQKVFIGSLVVIASYFGYDSLTYKCMIWSENLRFVKVSCEEKNAIPIDEVVLNNFQRIDPGCIYPFYKEDGSANLWYGKSIKGEYEYFNHLGVHPITQKTLKEVTGYIIKKHICKSY